MAEVDSQINLIMLWNLKNRLLVLHVNCDKFVADLRSVLSIVDKAELVRGDLLFQLWVFIESNTFRLNFLAPAVLIQALSEKDHIGKDYPVVRVIDAVAHPVEIKSKDLVHKHFLSIFVSK